MGVAKCSAKTPGTVIASRYSHRHTTLWNLVFQISGITTALISGIVLVPFYLRHIESDLFGAWSASGNIVTWITLVDPGLSYVLQQRVATAYGRRDHTEAMDWMVSGLWVALGLSLVFCVVGVGVSFFLGNWLRLPAGVDAALLARAFRWSVVGSALMMLSFSLVAANQALQGSFAIGLISTLSAILRIVLVIGFISAGHGLLAIALPTVVTASLLVIANAIYLAVRIRREGMSVSFVPRRLSAIGALLSFSGIAKVAGVLINNIDLFVVARLLGPESVNILRFTRTPAAMFRMFAERPFGAVQPALSHLLGEGGLDRARGVLLRLLAITTWLLALATGAIVIFNAEFVALWVGARFYAGTGSNLLIALWFVASVISAALTSLCFAGGDIRRISMASAVQAAVYLPLLLVGAHFWGLIGVIGAGAVSVLMSRLWFMVRAFSNVYHVRRLEWLQLGRNAGGAALAAAVSALVFARVDPKTWFDVGVAVSGYATCFIVSLLLTTADARREGSLAFSWSAARVRRLRATFNP